MPEDWSDKPDRYQGMNAAPSREPEISLVWDQAGVARFANNHRSELLLEAERLVNGDRNNQYGPPSQDFQRAAAIATALGYTGPGGRPFLPHDIALLITGVKLSRLVWSPEKRDSWVDIAGYAACGWECVVEEDDKLE